MTSGTACFDIMLSLSVRAIVRVRPLSGLEINRGDVNALRCYDDGRTVEVDEMVDLSQSSIVKHTWTRRQTFNEINDF